MLNIERPFHIYMNHCNSFCVTFSSISFFSITPFFKSGDKNLANNYRPICKNSTTAQILDCIVAKKLNDVFQSVIAIQQHGFTKGKSTLSNLIAFTENIHKAFSEKCQLDAVYTDFSKVFDSVCHLALLYKLSCSGISGDLLRWLESYLHDRFQVVKIGRCYSTKFKSVSGVPLGSHLGPLLFLLFINDLTWIMDTQVGISIFADDIKIFKKVQSPSDINLLQRSLDILSDYCTHFQLSLNINKCFHITFSRKVKRKFHSS